MTFWVLIALMVFSAMGFICMPMLRTSLSSKSELDSEQTLYKARISEIDKDIELGRLDEASAIAAKSEEARRLIKVSENSKATLTSSTSRVPVLLAALSLPLVSIPLYYNFGSPQIGITQESDIQPAITDLVKVAEKRLSKNPDDVRGWNVLAPVYVRLKRYEDAINAYQNILRLEGRKPESILKLVDVYIEKQQGHIDDTAKALIDETLSIDNDNLIAKFYTGIAELQNGNKEETRRIWTGIVDSAKGDEDWLPVIKKRLAELTDSSQASPLPKLDNDTVKAAEAMAPEDRAAMIVQMVSNLAQKLEEKPNDKQGWERLIRSYMTLGKTKEALLALEKASEQYSDDENFISLLKQLTEVQNSTQGENQ